MTEVLRSFYRWEQSHLDPNQILQDLLTKLGITDVTAAQLEEVMNQEYTRHTDALNTQRARLIEANFFDLPAQCSVPVASKYLSGLHSAAFAAVSKGATSDGATSSDIGRSVLVDGVKSDAGSASSVLHFEGKTGLQYFDCVVERYGQALTTFKDDLIRLKDLEAGAVMTTS